MGDVFPSQKTEEPPSMRQQLAVDRTMLANERTLLAYVRTALGLLLVGLAILHFPGNGWSAVAGGIFAAGAVATVGIGVASYRRTAKRITAVATDL